MAKFGVIIAARTSSSRLPGKALLPLMGMPMIAFLIQRLRDSKRADCIVFATTTLTADDVLAATVSAENIPVFRGANEDVVARYVAAAQQFDIEYVVRVTGDCPFVDAETLDYCLAESEKFGTFDLASTKTAFPVGIDYEIYRDDLMRELDKSDKLSLLDREHLTKYLYDHKAEFDIRVINPLPQWDWREKVFTVDTPQDYAFALRLVECFDNPKFSVEALIQAARR